MTNNIKILRQISNARVLLACSNEEFIKDIQSILESEAQVLAVVKVVVMDKLVHRLRLQID